MKLQLNKEEQDYKLIQIDGKFVVVDLNAKIAVGNCVLSQLEQIVTASANTIDLYNGGCRKVLAATPKLNLPVFQLPEREDEVEKLAESYSDGFPISSKAEGANAYRLGLNDGFIVGYKAANKGYSEEDLRLAIELAQEEFICDCFLGAHIEHTHSEDEIIQFLNQPTIEITLENTQIKSAKWVR